MYSSFLRKSRRLIPKCKLCHEVISRRRPISNSSSFSNEHVKNLYSSKGDKIGQTVLIVQDGTDVQELPYVVRHLSANDTNILLFENNDGTGNSSGGSDDDVTNDGKTSSFTLDNDERILDEELKEIVKGFQKCHSTKELLQLLETVPSDYVLPNVALEILAKMIALDREKPFVVVYPNNDGSAKTPDSNFTEKAVSNQLMEVILSNRDVRIFVDVLKLMNTDAAFRKFLSAYRRNVDDTVLINVTENKYSVEDICDIIKQYRYLSFLEEHGTTTVDKFWFGITEKSHEIDHRNIMRVFNVLPYLKSSRQIVLNALTLRFTNEWWRVSGTDIAEILAILTETNSNAYRMFEIIGRWLNTNIHTVSEDELLKIVNGLRTVEFGNTQIRSALERYVKAKYGKIRNPALLARIADYCSYFRWRSVVILDVCERYIVDTDESADTFLSSANVFKSVFVPFGTLSYRPSNPSIFWQRVERIIERKFGQLNPEDLIDVMLSCVCLNKYPINFVGDVFNAYFLGKIRTNGRRQTANGVSSINGWTTVKDKLRILDTAIRLNRPDSYKRKQLPSESNASFCSEFRVQRMTPIVSKHLLSFVDSSVERIACHVIPFALPCISLYLIDLLLMPPNTRARELSACRRFDESYVAVLIHLPEHYCSPGRYLIGPQTLRRNLLRSNGMKVASLDYDVLKKLQNEPKELADYIKDAVTKC